MLYWLQDLELELLVTMETHVRLACCDVLLIDHFMAICLYSSYTAICLIAF